MGVRAMIGVVQFMSVGLICQRLVPCRFSAEAMQESQRRWRDGSLEEDLPMRSLSEMFNVNYFLVSQTNPHIVPALNLKKRVNRKLGNLLEAEWKHRRATSYSSRYAVLHYLLMVLVMVPILRLHASFCPEELHGRPWLLVLVGTCMRSFLHNQGGSCVLLFRGCTVQCLLLLEGCMQ